MYCRKSVAGDKGEDFGSIDAQRQAGEHYVASQAHDGWRAIEHVYEDEGFSGGTMKRPGLERLLADIKSGKIDVVVVYKVDRISRSLLDFMRLMEVFDKYNVAFVSTTQSFNTATSMGRLILNILMSFAEFERDQIRERVRDNIGHKRKNGQATGGRPILGFDSIKAKLIAVPKEVALVQHIFERFCILQSETAVAREMNEAGYHTKTIEVRKGKNAGEKRGGHPFDRESVRLANSAQMTGATLPAPCRCREGPAAPASRSPSELAWKGRLCALALPSGRLLRFNDPRCASLCRRHECWNSDDLDPRATTER